MNRIASLLTLAATLFGGQSALSQTEPAPQPAPVQTVPVPQPRFPGDTDTGFKPLTWGDPAPGIQVETWLKGDAVKALEKGRIYVVDFWATWCTPCRESMPRLSALQREYKDKGVTVIGVSIWEQAFPIESGKGTYLDRARTLVETMGDKIDYRVAFDGDTAYMNQEWMHRTNTYSIPAAFIVNKEGLIAWIGHPDDAALRTALDSIIAGTYDLESAARTAREQRDKEQRIRRAENRARIAMDGLDAEESERSIDRLLEMDAKRYGPWALRCFEMMLTSLGDPPNAYRYADKLLGGPFGQDPAMTNQLAWIIVDSQDIAIRDLAIAMRAATKAVELSGGKDASICNTLARVLQLRGQWDEAIAMQQKAVDLAPDAAWKAELTATLEQWKKDRHAK